MKKHPGSFLDGTAHPTALFEIKEVSDGNPMLQKKKSRIFKQEGTIYTGN